MFHVVHALYIIIYICKMLHVLYVFTTKLRTEADFSDYVEVPPERHPPPAWLTNSDIPKEPVVEGYSNDRLPPNPIGMENGNVRNEQITASGKNTDDGINCDPWLARLNADQCWIANDSVYYTTFY